MAVFFSDQEHKICKQFLSKGYCVFKANDKNKIIEIRKKISIILRDLIKIKKKVSDVEILNYAHKLINKKSLNEIRLKIFNKLSNSKELRKNYYLLSKNYLDILVGNELAMQKKINLSIQMPKDNSSLLPIHSDVWSGDSPYEIVVWIPLVDCKRTKSMYILPAKKYKKFENQIKKIPFKNKSSDQILKFLKNDITWIDIKFGEILVFNQCLPHGNVVNREKETRWSLNCRFKSLLTPYKDKKLGEFFEPITLRPVTEIGMDYNLPKFSE